MTKHSLDLSDDEILARLVTRRDIARNGAVTALVAVPALLVTPGHGREASAQSTAGTATAEESTIYRPATPVGSPQPGPTRRPRKRWDLLLVRPARCRSSRRLVHGPVVGAGRRGRLDPQRGSQLLALIASDPERRRSLDDLLAIRANGEATTPIATPVAALSGDSASSSHRSCASGISAPGTTSRSPIAPPPGSASAPGRRSSTPTPRAFAGRLASGRHPLQEV